MLNNQIEMQNDVVERLYFKMLLIRNFENRLLELFSDGKLSGTTHTYVGQEAIAVSVIDNLMPNDVIFSNHRCHGHYLAYENDPGGLFAEIMGKSTGVCGGRGGSQHLHKRNFYSNGIQGSYLPIVVGMAMAEKRRVLMQLLSHSLEMALGERVLCMRH